MTENADDVVMLASGSLVEVELWQATLRGAGIDCRVVGTELTTGLGSAFPGTIELWVHRGDAERAAAAVKYAEDHRDDVPKPPVPHGIPESERVPDAARPERRTNRPNTP